jgi:hypothetical protein
MRASPFSLEEPLFAVGGVLLRSYRPGIWLCLLQHFLESIDGAEERLATFEEGPLSLGLRGSIHSLSRLYLDDLIESGALLHSTSLALEEGLAES